MVTNTLPSNQQTFQHYIFFWMGQLVSLLGSSVVFFAVFWWLTIETESPTVLSLTFFFALIPWIAISLLAGPFIDRLNRKKIIIFADFFQALLTFILILMFVFNLTSVWGVISLIVLREMFQAIHQPTVGAIIPVMIPKDKLSRMNAINMLVSSAIHIVGPIISGILIGFWDIELILWIDVGTFLFALIPTILITIPSINPSKTDKNGQDDQSLSDRENLREEFQPTEKKVAFKKELKEGWYAIIQVKGMLAIFITCILLNALIIPSSALRPFFISIYHEGDAKMLSYVSGVMQVGMVMGGVLISLRKQWKRKSLIIFIAFLINGISYMVIGLAPKGNFLLIMIGLFFFGTSFPIIGSLYLTILQEVIPLEMQGRVNAINNAVSMALSPIVVLVSGPIAELIGINYLFIILASLFLIILTGSFLFTDIRHIDKGIIIKNEPKNSTVKEERKKSS